MSSKLEDALRVGREAAAQLAVEIDRLTETLAQIERALSELRLGVEASVPLTEELALAFEKEGKIWRLTVKSATGSQLLINASRGSRMLAVDKLNDLLLTLVDEACAKTGEVREVATRADGYLEALRGFVRQHERT